MSGGGLWFVVCIPTQEHERERYESPPNGVHPSLTTVPSYNSAVSLSRGNTNGNTEETEVKSPHNASLEQVLRKTLEELQIFDALWVLDESGKFHKVTFPCDPGLRCDFVLTTLTTNGVGMCKGSSLGILPCSVLLQDDDFCLDGCKNTCETVRLLSEDKKSDSGSSTLSKTKSDIKKAFRGFKGMQKKFLKTITARLTVAQVVEGVRAGAEPSFDFIIFAVVASMIAALGLLENSSVVIVASMLISPIMGPILAATFGTVIRDRSLRNVGIKTEILGLFICLSFGFLFGLLGGLLNHLWGHQEWPTMEMSSRGQDRSLWIGLLIALPSGVGVALSVLGGNAASLVGVAISASLLPPAVNAGLLWGIALILNIRAQDEQMRFIHVNGVTRLAKPSLAPNEGYQFSYFEEMDRECAMLGLISLVLALVNIACIFVAAVVVLKIKEVAPRTSLSKTSRFWKEDIKIARDYNSTSAPTKPEELGDQFLAEWVSLNGLEPGEVLNDDEEARITRMETLKDMIQDVEADEVYQTVTQSLPNKRNTRPMSQRMSQMQSTHVDVSDANAELARDTYRRPSGVRSFFVADQLGEAQTPDSSASSDFSSVQLRHPEQPRITRSPSSRASVAILRQSLMNTTDNPYTLWPSAIHRPLFDGRSRGRHTMEPLSEDSVSGPPVTRQRVSRFLQVPEAVFRETTC